MLVCATSPGSPVSQIEFQFSFVLSCRIFTGEKNLNMKNIEKIKLLPSSYYLRKTVINKLGSIFFFFLCILMVLNYWKIQSIYWKIQRIWHIKKCIKRARDKRPEQGSELPGQAAHKRSRTYNINSRLSDTLFQPLCVPTHR